MRAFMSGPKPENNPARPADNKKPSEAKPNDKLMVVKGVDYDDLKKALIEFCNLYNNEKFQALLHLTKISDREFAITFPYDIDFEIYCYFVNYIYYPMDIKWKPTVTAWTTTKQGDTWIEENAMNKKVMLFVPENDAEHDNVFMTTEDNTGYKLGFAMGENSQPLDTPKINFMPPTVDQNTLSGKQTEDFQ